MRGINQWQLISNYTKLQYAFEMFLKESVILLLSLTNFWLILNHCAMFAAH